MPANLFAVAALLLIVIASCERSLAADDLGATNIEIQSELANEPLNPGVVAVSPQFASGAIYDKAAEGHLIGSGALVGHFSYLSHAAMGYVGVAEYQRDGSTIRILFQQHLHDDVKTLPAATTMTFTVVLPATLPDGHYKAVCDLECVDQKNKPATQPVRFSCEFDLPDSAIAIQRIDEQFLKGLSNTDLLAEYVKRGNLLKGTWIGPIDDDLHFQAAFSYYDDRLFSWEQSGSEITRRGEGMIPLLMEMLPREVIRNAHKDVAGSYGFGFARNLIQTMSEIGDPRPVPLLVDIVAGNNGRANPRLREVALDAVEKLTFISFDLDANARNRSVFDAVPVLDDHLKIAAPGRDLNSEYYDASAERYRQWLNGEGKDSSRWIALAQNRARQILSADNFPAIYEAVEFLQGRYWEGNNRSSVHDENPEETMARVDQILREAQRTGKSEYGSIYAWKNNEIGVGDGGLPVDLLGRYGPRARKYVPDLIRVNQGDDLSWSRVEVGNEIGGKPWMAELISLLPPVNARLKKLGLTADTSMHDVGGHVAVDPDFPKEEAVTLSQTIRWGIDRWAGRTFANDNEIIDWWHANQGKTEEQWLEDNLQMTADRADHTIIRDQYLLRLIIPDLSADDHEGTWAPPPSFSQPELASRPAKPFRAKWLRQNQMNLKYDSQSGCFKIMVKK